MRALLLIIGVVGLLGWRESFAVGVPSTPVSFWDGGLVIGVGRVGWVYYHVTVLPAYSVLYCPGYPELPEGYPEWPKKRLARPISVESNGGIYMRDPGVEEARQQEQAERAGMMEGLWARLMTELKDCWVKYIPKSQPFRYRNFIFRPRLDEQFMESTIFRYLPPDQFWQICSEDVILVPTDDGADARSHAIERGKRDRKMVLLVGATPYAETAHTEDFWEPWSVFVSGYPAIASHVPYHEDIPQRTRAGSSEPDHMGEQTGRKWRILRQVDLRTGALVEVLVDSEGEMVAPWSISESGARFEMWIMQWGTVRARLVSCWSMFRSSNPDCRPIAARITGSGDGTVASGQSYHVNWNGDGALSGEYSRQLWEEDEDGNLLSAPRFDHVDCCGGENRTALQPDGAECLALWWRPADGEWRLLSECRQRIIPLPRVDLAWPDPDHFPLGQALDLSGRHFPAQGTARVVIKQGNRRIVAKEITEKEDWELSLNLTDLGVETGRANLTVEYSDPWRGQSHDPETCRIEKAMEVRLTIVN